MNSSRLCIGFLVAVVLLPILLFAVLHICSYSLTLLDLLGPGSLGAVRMAIGIAEAQSVNILRTISFSEIFIFPVTVVMLLRSVSIKKTFNFLAL